MARLRVVCCLIIGNEMRGRIIFDVLKWVMVHDSSTV